MIIRSKMYQEGKYVQGSLALDNTGGGQGGGGRGQGPETNSSPGLGRGVREWGGEQTFFISFVLMNSIVLCYIKLLLFVVTISCCQYPRIDMTPSLPTIVTWDQ